MTGDGEGAAQFFGAGVQQIASIITGGMIRPASDALIDPSSGSVNGIYPEALPGATAAAQAVIRKSTSAVIAVANPVPQNLARVVPGNISPKMLGRSDDVFVTDANALIGLNARQIANKLTISQSTSGFKIISFPSKNISGIASPINRTNPGFIQGGRTAGGAPEFVIPNGPIPAGATIKVVQ